MEGTNDDEFASNQINTIFVCDGPDDDHNQIINSIADEMIDNYIPISDLPSTSPFYNPDHLQSIFMNLNITTPASPSIDLDFIASIATPQDACIFDGSFNHTMLINSGSQVTMIPTHHPLHDYTILQPSARHTLVSATQHGQTAISLGTLHLPSATSPAEHFRSQHTPGLPVHALSPSQHVADNKHYFGYTLDMNADTGKSILTFKNRFDPTANVLSWVLM